MGTGKSIQALVAIACKHADVSQSMETDAPFRSLIVCPATLVGHWDGEISKCFAPQTIFTSLCLIGSRVERVQKWSSRSESVNIVIVSYSVLRSDVDLLGSEKWCYCVLDEGHLLKNPKTGPYLISKLYSTRRME
jgi:TATA-binding protein-associated factor